jgi:hypothetical protein
VPRNLRQARTIPRQAPDHRSHLVRPCASPRAASRREIIAVAATHAAAVGGSVLRCRAGVGPPAAALNRKSYSRSGHRSTDGIGRVPASTLMVGRPPRQRQRRAWSLPTSNEFCVPTTAKETLWTGGSTEQPDPPAGATSAGRPGMPCRPSARLRLPTRPICGARDVTLEAWGSRRTWHSCALSPPCRRQGGFRREGRGGMALKCLWVRSANV